jgi:hypothetical protein
VESIQASRLIHSALSVVRPASVSRACCHASGDWTAVPQPPVPLRATPAVMRESCADRDGLEQAVDDLVRKRVVASWMSAGSNKRLEGSIGPVSGASPASGASTTVLSSGSLPSVAASGAVSGRSGRSGTIETSGAAGSIVVAESSASGGAASVLATTSDGAVRPGEISSVQPQSRHASNKTRGRMAAA